jgi:hypothetical protein
MMSYYLPSNTFKIISPGTLYFSDTYTLTNLNDIFDTSIDLSLLDTTSRFEFANDIDAPPFVSFY